MQIFESSLKDLYRSAVIAFPTTTKRQHSTDLVVITELQWMPFIGTKTLFTKGLAQSGESGKEYSPIILFKRVNYDGDSVRITASDGLEYNFGPLSLENTDVALRCGCKDFYWRFNYYNSLEKSLQGRVRSPYESVSGRPPANPQEMPGMCKHLMKMIKVLQEAGVFEGQG
jgi:hypothetical protein